MRHLLCLAVLGALATTGTGVGDTWWWDFEFNDPNDLPPDGDGWLRRYQPAPFGVVENGILTYSSEDTSSYDFFELSRPGALDPGPNELFVATWRLLTTWVTFHWGDPSVAVQSDDAWHVCFLFSPNAVHSFVENVDIPVTEGWHTYELFSTGMRFYDLYIDGSLAREGYFVQLSTASGVEWGDGGDGIASTHYWDSFGVGVVQAPVAGDTNCDGSVDFRDINPFIQALTDAEAYEQVHPGCWLGNADINDDGSVDFADINPFVDLLTS